MPACTGLPPGELMRSTTACAPVSSKALVSAATRFSALASDSLSISPRISTSAVCGPDGAVIAMRCDISPQATAKASASHTSLKKMRQRRSLRRSRSNSRAASSSAFSRRAEICGAVARAGAAVGAPAGAPSSCVFIGSLPQAGASKGTGRISREGYQYTCPSRSWTSTAVNRPRPQGPATQRPPIGS